MEKQENNLMEKIISLCKRRGFIYQGSEIYGGLAGTWDYGPLGVSLKNNIKNLWWQKFVDSREDMYGVDAAIIMNSKVWQSAGHVDNFADPMSECEKCKKRFRTDQLTTGNKCPECAGNLGNPKKFNMMFATKIGALEDSSATVYLRPETAQGMFVNFKNVVDSFHPKLPFGLAQIGKAFRNEITPRDFIFRVRELEQMEIEYFLKEEDWQKYFDYWKEEMLEWMNSMGIDMNHVHELEVEEGDRAHYSSRTIDFEFDFPFGRSELYGLAYRSDFDLNNHSNGSKVDLSYFDEETKEKVAPHVVEPTFGVERTFLALMVSAYREEKMENDVRPYLAFKPNVAPVICAVSPLLKNKQELRDYAHMVYRDLKSEFGRVMWDDNGNIGKRYRRQDEIGTPWCIVIDFDTLKDDSVTVRDRDTGKQERIKKEEIVKYIKEKLN
jgi:glycyl-tRNA synthetase